MAGEYSTFVFYHASEEDARGFRTEMISRYPFGGAGKDVSQITAMATGDAMSVSDAMRMALECRALDRHERSEFALELAECVSWDDCVAHAKTWELRVRDGDFVDDREPALAQDGRE